VSIKGFQELLDYLDQVARARLLARLHDDLTQYRDQRLERTPDMPYQPEDPTHPPHTPDTPPHTHHTWVVGHENTPGPEGITVYHVTAQRWRVTLAPWHQGWELHIHGPGIDHGVTQCHTLGEVEETVRDYVRVTLDLDEDTPMLIRLIEEDCDCAAPSLPFRAHLSTAGDALIRNVRDHPGRWYIASAVVLTLAAIRRRRSKGGT
jgi:hypothetical protein